MSLVGYQRGSSRALSDKGCIDICRVTTDAIAQETDAFDEEERKRTEADCLASLLADQKKHQKICDPDRPIFVISRALIELVTNFAVLAVLAGAVAALKDDRVFAIFNHGFPTFSRFLGRLGINSALELVYWTSFGLTLVSVVFMLCMAFSLFQKVGGVIENKWFSPCDYPHLSPH